MTPQAAADAATTQLLGGQLDAATTQLLLSIGTLSETLTRTVFKQATSALAAVHAHNLCHRDIRPENVLFDASYSVKLSGFGFACPVGAGSAPCVSPCPRMPWSMT